MKILLYLSLVTLALVHTSVTDTRIHLQPGEYHKVNFSNGALDTRADRPSFYDDGYYYTFRGQPQWLVVRGSSLVGIVPLTAWESFPIAMDFRSQDGNHWGNSMYAFVIDNVETVSTPATMMTSSQGRSQEGDVTSTNIKPIVTSPFPSVQQMRQAAPPQVRLENSFSNAMKQALGGTLLQRAASPNEFANKFSNFVIRSPPMLQRTEDLPTITPTDIQSSQPKIIESNVKTTSKGDVEYTVMPADDPTAAPEPELPTDIPVLLDAIPLVIPSSSISDNSITTSHSDSYDVPTIDVLEQRTATDNSASKQGNSTNIISRTKEIQPMDKNSTNFTMDNNTSDFTAGNELGVSKTQIRLDVQLLPSKLFTGGSLSTNTAPIIQISARDGNNVTANSTSSKVSSNTVTAQRIISNETSTPMVISTPATVDQLTTTLNDNMDKNNLATKDIVNGVQKPITLSVHVVPRPDVNSKSYRQTQTAINLTSTDKPVAASNPRTTETEINMNANGSLGPKQENELLITTNSNNVNSTIRTESINSISQINSKLQAKTPLGLVHDKLKFDAKQRMQKPTLTNLLPPVDPQNNDNSCTDDSINWTGQGVIALLGASWIQLESGIRVNIGKCTKIACRSRQTGLQVNYQVAYEGHQDTSTSKIEQGWAKRVDCK